VGIITQPKKTFEDSKTDSLIFVFSLYFLIFFFGLVLELIIVSSAVHELKDYSLYNMFLYDSIFNFLVPIAKALIGTGMLAIITIIAKKKHTFQHAARIFLYANIPLALFFFLMTGIINPLVKWLPFLQSIANFEFILTIVFWIWTIILIIIGLKVIFGLSTKSATVCSVAGFLSTYLLTVTMIQYTYLTVREPTSMMYIVYRFQLLPVILIVVFGLYYILEKLLGTQNNTG
jgi:hypothetical protein